jgi:hypothetical protein
MSRPALIIFIDGSGHFIPQQSNTFASILTLPANFENLPGAALFNGWRYIQERSSWYLLHRLHCGGTLLPGAVIQAPIRMCIFY